MREKKPFFLLAVLIVFLLAAGIAFVRFWNQQTGGTVLLPGPSAKPPAKTNRISEQRLEQLKAQELLGVTANVSPKPVDGANWQQTEAEPQLLGTSDLPVTPREKNNSPYQAQPTTTGPRASGSLYQAAQTALNEKSQPLPTSYSSSQSGRRDSSSSAMGADASAAYLSPQTDQETSTQQNQRIMAPFLRGLTREQAEALNRSLDGLSSRVERAILQAMLPKSKKNANIEKYLQRNRADQTQPSTQAEAAQAQGPFAHVLRQVSSQRANITKSMGNAYGSAAAKEAGNIMKSYQKELTDLLDKADGKSAEQLAKQARAIGDKYNDKLDKVSEKYGLEKFKQENIAKDQAYLAEMNKAYGGEIASQMAELRQQALEQKMQLAQEDGLTTEQAYAKHLSIEQDLWDKEQKLLIEQGYSPSKMYDIKKGLKEDQRLLNEQAEQAGEKIAQVYRMSETQQQEYLKAVDRMNQPMQQNDVASYGTQGAETLKPVYDWYTREVQRIIADTETSQDEKDQALQEASTRANQELSRLKKTPEMKKKRVDTALEHILQDPALQRASTDQRSAFKEGARPILEEMFDKATEIEESNLSEPEKRRQLQALQEEAQRRLSGGQ